MSFLMLIISGPWLVIQHGEFPPSQALDLMLDWRSSKFVCRWSGMARLFVRAYQATLLERPHYFLLAGFDAIDARPWCWRDWEPVGWLDLALRGVAVCFRLDCEWPP
jgi:hypothetical protein